MKTIEQLEQEFAKAKAAAEKSAEGVDEKIVSLLGNVIHAAFLQYTIGMMQKRESNEERLAKECFGDGSGKSLPEVSQEERDSDGWIEWNGGQCPIGESVLVETRTRNGFITQPWEASELRWENAGRNKMLNPDYDIIAYRIVK